MTVEENLKGIKVWDLFVRIFHWSLAVTFLVSYLTEGEYGLHFYAGWFIGILLLSRMVWGVIGSKYSKFSDFVKSPSNVLSYTKTLLTRQKNEKVYLGHNPLGGMMVVVMIISLSCTVVSGVMLYQEEGNDSFDFIGRPVFVELDEEHSTVDKIPHTLRALEENEENEFWEEIHEFFSNFSLALILFHIAGVIFSSRRENRNLIKSMITGKK